VAELGRRIPVRIRIERLPGNLHLAAGMTATLHVDSHGGTGFGASP
jgi:multidrug resistance efflux pump